MNSATTFSGADITSSAESVPFYFTIFGHLAKRDEMPDMLPASKAHRAQGFACIKESRRVHRNRRPANEDYFGETVTDFEFLDP